jgi:hypothetical protein
VLHNLFGFDPAPTVGSNLLKWVNVGPDKPRQGRELKNLKLAHELQRKTTFSPQEWQEFGVGVPGSENFVKASASYLRPATLILTPIFTLSKP